MSRKRWLLKFYAKWPTAFGLLLSSPNLVRGKAEHDDSKYGTESRQQAVEIVVRSHRVSKYAYEERHPEGEWQHGDASDAPAGGESLDTDMVGQHDGLQQEEAPHRKAYSHSSGEGMPEFIRVWHCHKADCFC